MNRTKIAIKALTGADLSLFKAHQRLSTKRAINLASEIFIKRFYLGLQSSYDPVVLSLVIIGPRARAPHRLTRMLMRSVGTKSWHLQGEPIYDPMEEPSRYGKLAENDFALMAFEGNARPRTMTLILVSAAEDAELHATLAERFELPAKHTLVEVPEAAIAQLRVSTLSAYPSNEHPLDALISHDTVEDVLFGADVLPPAAEGRTPIRPVAKSPEDLRRQIIAADENSQLGEELFEAWLIATGHKDEDFTWISQTHARSAYHYEVYTAQWLNGAPHVFVAVKATRASFERPIHMSISELRFAAKTENYRIARLYNMAGETPKLRILTGVQTVAERLVETLDTLPNGVMADSLRLDPGVFEIELETKTG